VLRLDCAQPAHHFFDRYIGDRIQELPTHPPGKSASPVEPWGYSHSIVAGGLDEMS
jgi:hypothetical protein